MNRTLRNLEESENLRVRAVADLAIGMDVSFERAQELMDKMVEEAKKKISLQEQFEVAMAAEFNC